MKKLFCIILTVCMLLACASALAASPSDLVGDWYLQYRKTGILSDDQYPQTAVKVSFNRDKTITVTYGDNELGGTWNISQFGLISVTPDGMAEISANLQTDGLLTGTFNDPETGSEYIWYFGREDVFSELPAPVDTAQEEDFFGKWVAYRRLENGNITKLTEKDGRITVEFAQITYADGYFGEYTAVTDFADGKLTFSAEDIRVGEGRMYAQLTEDPNIAVIRFENDDENGVAVYIIRADAAEQAAGDGEEAPAE